LAAWAAVHASLSLASTWAVIGLSGGVVWLISARWVGPTSVRQLTWDGQQWALQGQPGKVAVMLDFGVWLLLRFRSTGLTQWVPVDLRHCGAPPALCRAALRAHAGGATANGPLVG
jgi:hypothetical protein